MLTLPVFPPRRAWLWAFWNALSLGVGVFLAALLTLASDWTWIAAAIVVTAGLLSIGWRWPRIIELPYRTWNKLAREFARWGSLWVLAVCYYCIFKPVGLAGSSFRIAAPASGESLWVKHPTLSPAAHLRASAPRGWVANYLLYCSGARSLWAIWLLPFLLLLSLLGTEEHKGTVPSNIYTLY